MTKARTQPSAKTGIVLKISIAFILLLAIVLYKLNDHYKQEKWQLAQNQLRTKIVSVKTAVSTQIATLRNVLSSYQNELVESKINWVQLDPFFSIALAQKTTNSAEVKYKILQYVGRSGSLGERWNAAYLEQALSLQKQASDQPVTVQLFQDRAGSKFISIRYVYVPGRAVIVVGSADYFQRFFDLDRGGKTTSLLETTEHILAAHSEADYVATLSDEHDLSEKKYLIEKEEIAGTNLIAMGYGLKKSLSAGFSVPWSIVGLLVGFACLIIGFVFYNLDPLEKRVEKYKKQEREEIFKATLKSHQAALQAEQKNEATADVKTEVSGQTEPEQKNEVGLSVSQLIEKTSSQASTEVADEEEEFKIVGGLPSSPNQQSVKTPSSAPPDASLVVSQQVVNDLLEKSIFVSPDTDQVMKEIEARVKAQMDKGIMSSKPKQEVAVESKMPTLKDKTTEVDTNPDLEATVIHQKSLEDSLDNLDLEKVLSLDDVDQEPTVITDVQKIQQAMTSQKIKMSPTLSEIKKPDFQLKTKTAKVDALTVKMRRPEKI